MLSQSLMRRAGRRVLSFGVVGVIGVIVLLATALAQAPPPPPPVPGANGWTVDAPSGGTFSRNANIACDGDASNPGIRFSAGISVYVGNTWVAQNTEFRSGDFYWPAR